MSGQRPRRPLAKRQRPRTELKWLSEGGSQASAAQPIISKRTRRDLLSWAIAGAAIVAAVVMAVIYLRGSARPTQVVRSLITVEEGTSAILTGDFAGPPVVSPNGSVVAFVAARDQGAALLWVRPLSSIHAHPLVGTEGATFPFWSPDSRSLGFFSGGKLRTVSVDGGTPSEICAAAIGRGGSWGSQGIIVFSPDFQSPLQQVPASGGTPTAATVMDKSKHDSHRWPYFLPDGKHFLYLAVIHASTTDANDGIYMASVDRRENHLVMKGFTNVAYAAGRLLFMRDNVLVAQPFNPGTGALQGEAERLAEDVLQDQTTWRAQFDSSVNGLLIYVSGGLTPWQAMWYDRSGKSLGPAGEKVFNLLSLRLSPDGSRLATEAGESQSEIWIYDRNRSVNTRLTFGPSQNSSPVWSPDGQWIAYAGVRTKNGLFRKPANGMGQEEMLLEGDSTSRNPWDWSSDGKFLLFGVGDFTAKGQAFVLPLGPNRADDRKPVALTQDTYTTNSARFSPDGHWVAYASNESGRFEVYVTPFGSGTGKWQVSAQGGIQPVWRRDGKELFYWSPDNTIISVPITLKADGVEMGAAHSLFRFNSPLGIVGVISPYDATPDGQRLVLITTPEQAPRPITLVTNWTTELKNK